MKKFALQAKKKNFQKYIDGLNLGMRTAQLENEDEDIIRAFDAHIKSMIILKELFND